MKRGRVVAIAGVTGAVGEVLLRILEQREFPIAELRPLASERSAGTTVKFRGKDLPVEIARPEAFDGVDFVFFAATGITRDMLDELARSLPDDAFDAAVRWIAAAHTARGLAADVERATRRIHDLVSAVKRFTFMDRATVGEPSSIAQPLADTVAVLAAKARAKSAMVTLDIPVDLPRVKMYGGELNQVWSNLLENALDSVGEHGKVAVNARAEPPGNVVVRIVDDGPGIPAENMKRIFDPFFTTKPIGQGTGLGLDIARRIVRRHDGDIDVDSRPGGGRTEFRVTLPAL
jgi:signal transduction histidine kinase